jgi:hypothetical protein
MDDGLLGIGSGLVVGFRRGGFVVWHVECGRGRGCGVIVCDAIGDGGLAVPDIIEALSEIQTWDGPLGQPILELVVERRVLIDGVEEGTHECGLFLVEERITGEWWWVGKRRELKVVGICKRGGIGVFVVVL